MSTPTRQIKTIPTSRKTMSVYDLIMQTNSQLKRTDEYATTDYKRALCDILEFALHQTKNYNGFGFINNRDSELGTLGFYSRFYYIKSKLMNHIIK